MGVRRRHEGLVQTKVPPVVSLAPLPHRPGPPDSLTTRQNRYVHVECLNEGAVNATGPSTQRAEPWPDH